MGLYVTVTRYRGRGVNPFGHIGIGVNSSWTFGFYGDDSLSMSVGDPVPGQVALDSGHEVVETIRIDTTTPEQERAIVEFIIQRYLNPGTYTLGGRNCAAFVGALRAGRLDTNGSVVPYSLMQDVKQRYGAPASRRR
jgi:hypothetical protein